MFLIEEARYEEKEMEASTGSDIPRARSRRLYGSDNSCDTSDSNGVSSDTNSNSHNTCSNDNYISTFTIRKANII